MSSLWSRACFWYYPKWSRWRSAYSPAICQSFRLSKSFFPCSLGGHGQPIAWVIISSFLSFLNKYSYYKGRTPSKLLWSHFVMHWASVLFQRSQPADSRPFWLEFTNNLLDNTTYLFVSPTPCFFPLSIRAIATPAHPPGRTASKCVHRGWRGCGVCLQSLQRCSAPHPVDQTRWKEWQQIRAWWTALPQGVEGEDFLNPKMLATAASLMGRPHSLISSWIWEKMIPSLASRECVRKLAC